MTGSDDGSRFLHSETSGTPRLRPCRSARNLPAIGGQQRWVPIMFTLLTYLTYLTYLLTLLEPKTIILDQVGALNLEHRGSGIEDQGSGIEDRGSSIEDRGSRTGDRGSRIGDRSWKLVVRSCYWFRSLDAQGCRRISLLPVSAEVCVCPALLLWPFGLVPGSGPCRLGHCTIRY